MGLRTNVSGLVAAVRGDDEARYRLAERLAQTIHPEAIVSERERLWMDDAGFRDAYFRFRDRTQTRSMERMFMLDQLARLASDLPGDTAECGAYQGLSSYVICRQTAQAGRRHHVFDSFEGVSEPQPIDGDYWSEGVLAAGEDEVRRNLEGFDVATYKGWIPERFAEVEDRRFCLVHIDVDLYEPTRDSFAFFYDRMVPGGVMVLDDYGLKTCPGARAAVDECMAKRPEPVLLPPTGQGLVFKQ